MHTDTYICIYGHARLEAALLPPSEIDSGRFGAVFLKARKGDTYFTELAERVEYGKYVYIYTYMYTHTYSTRLRRRTRKKE